MSSPYHPQSNGLVKRFNKTLYEGIAKVAEELGSWDQYIQPVTSFLTLQQCKVTVLYLLDHKLYCLKLTRDYVTTLTNYKGWVTTKVGSTIPINYRGCVISIFRGNEHFPLSNFKGRVHFTRSYYSFTTISSYNSPRVRNKILRFTSVSS